MYIVLRVVLYVKVRSEPPLKLYFCFESEIFFDGVADTGIECAEKGFEVHFVVILPVVSLVGVLLVYTLMVAMNMGVCNRQQATAAGSRQQQAAGNGRQRQATAAGNGSRQQQATGNRQGNS